MTEHQSPDPPPEGPAHVLAAARYSLGGLARLWRETAFRHQVLAAALLLPLYLVLAEPFEIVVFILLALVGFAFEAVNTAIEELVDRVSPERSEMARHAKDLGSLGVALVLLAHGVLLGWVVLGGGGPG